jgi:hypothetical protein
VLSADIQNTFLTAPNKEKCWIWAGPEFGSDEGKPFIVTRALYGLRSAGASFRSFLANKLDDMGYKPSLADPDVWMRAAVKDDGEEYYEYLLVYVDDILCISMKPMDTMKDVQNSFKFKGDKIAPPETYLGAKLIKKKINGVDCWTMTSWDYIKAAVANIEEKLKKDGKRLPAKSQTPTIGAYNMELDGTPELDAEGITLYQELIGVLRWGTEIGRVDILTEVAMLSTYQAAPRQGHLEQILQIFTYLKHKPKITLYFDPSLPRIDMNTFETNTDDFKEQYRDAEDELPPRMPKPRGRNVTITAFVDASHAANKVTRRSHTGYILFINRAPVVWYSKKQSTVEASTFSSEFIAMKACMEGIVALRYKLRMFGVPIPAGEPANVLCDNQGVVNNTSKVESILNKKHSSIAYHGVRWSVAAGIMRVGKILGDHNLADAMTKRLSAARRDYLFGSWTY